MVSFRHSSCGACPLSAVIPGPERRRGSPESIIPVCGYGFRARRFASPRNDNRKLGAGRARCALAAFVVAILLPAAASAQDYPSRPITLIVPYSAGGGNDLMARTAAEKMSKTLGQQIVIENRGGAGGSIATRQIAKSAPDGYTLGLGGTGTLAINPTLYGSVGYDPRKDFAPIGLIATSALVVLRAPVAAGAHDPRSDRARQEKPGHAHLCLGRHRQRHPSRQRVFRRLRRHQADPRSLQRQLAGADRSDRRPRRDLFQLAAARGRAW